MFHPIPNFIRDPLSSLTYTLKRRGDEAPPWRTPFVTLNSSESAIHTYQYEVFFVFFLINCLLPVTYSNYTT